MVLERLTGVTKKLIIKWNRNYVKILGELIEKDTVYRKFTNIEILEMDEFLQTKDVFVDRSRNKILGHCSWFWSNRDAWFACINKACI